MYVGQNGCQTRTSSSHQEHFPFEVLKVFFLFAWDSSDGVSSFLAIRSHCESSLSGAVSLRWGSSQHLLLPRLLTVGRSIVQEVGRHFPFTFDLNHPTTLQHVPFACEHLVEVCRHLWAERKRADLCEAVSMFSTQIKYCVILLTAWLQKLTFVVAL